MPRIVAIDVDEFGQANRKYHRAYSHFTQMVTTPGFFERPRAIPRVRRAIDRLHERDRAVDDLVYHRLSFA